MVVQPLTGQREQAVEHIAHGHHRGAGVQRLAVDVHRPQLAAWRCIALDDLHRLALGRQGHCRGQATDAGADDDHRQHQAGPAGVWRRDNPS